MKWQIGISADFPALGSGVLVPIEKCLAKASIYVEYCYFEATGRDSQGIYVTTDDIQDLDGVVLLGYRFKPDTVGPDSRLAVIGRWGVGYDTLDVPSLTRNGCLLAITPDGVRRPVAEAILTFLLALAKGLFAKDRVVRSGDWSQRNAYRAVGLEGKVVGSIGLGNIGADLFRLLSPFGLARKLAHDPYGHEQTAQDLDVQLVSLEELLAESDFVCLNCPLNETTHHLMNRERLSLMKESAYLINTARGPIVDHEALIEALQSNTIAGAGLDVLDPEPLPVDSPLVSMSNVILAPHTLAWTDQLYQLNGQLATEYVLSVLSGTVPEPVVNPEVLANPIFQRKLQQFAARTHSS